MQHLRSTLLIREGSIVEYSYIDRVGGFTKLRGIVVEMKLHSSHFLTQLVVLQAGGGPDIIFIKSVTNIIAI
jgi:hypothetical protein